MLRQASVSDLLQDRVSRERGYVVITMRRYPRFVNRMLRDEYLSSMSPDPELFADWIAAKRRHQDHDGAFRRSRFEERFDIDDVGLGDLARLSSLAKRKDVYLVCQCPTGQRCHRELVLILARFLFDAPAEPPSHEYPLFQKRLREFRPRLKKLSLTVRPAPRTPRRSVPDREPIA